MNIMKIVEIIPFLSQECNIPYCSSSYNLSNAKNKNK